ncbi:MAG TPA: HD domain-containing protein, partial [Firmicutes bacterium]|nr:HD domain-containing protein [Bacillota bacterium]
CPHDFDHLLAVARLTYLLLIEQGERTISKELAYAAGLLHDIGRWQEYTENIDHALAGVELACPILEHSGFKPVEIKLISTAISQHRHIDRPGDKNNLHPLSRALYNADLFSRLCFKCSARESCRKYTHLPQGKKLCY